jgi:hypothetical protein
MTFRGRALALGLLAAALALLAGAPRALVELGRLQNRWDGHAEAPVVCSFRARTGVPCLGCGGTRALELAARGRVGEALRLNPLGAWAGLALWGTALVSVAALLGGRRPAWKAVFVTLATSGLLAFLVSFAWWWRRAWPALS